MSVAAVWQMVYSSGQTVFFEGQAVSCTGQAVASTGHAVGMPSCGAQTVGSWEHTVAGVVETHSVGWFGQAVAVEPSVHTVAALLHAVTEVGHLVASIGQIVGCWQIVSAAREVTEQ